MVGLNAASSKRPSGIIKWLGQNGRFRDKFLVDGTRLEIEFSCGIEESEFSEEQALEQRYQPEQFPADLSAGLELTHCFAGQE